MKKITKGAKQMAAASFAISTLCAGGYLIYKKTDSLTSLFKKTSNVKDWAFDSKLFDDFSIEKFKNVLKNNNFDVSIGTLASASQIPLQPATSVPSVEEEIPSAPKPTQDEEDDEDDDEEEDEEKTKEKNNAGNQSIAQILQLISSKFGSENNSDFTSAITTLQSIKDLI